MDRIEHLIAKFREDHPEMDADLLAEFAQHVRRVVADDIRQETKDGNVPVKLSLQAYGHSFSAQGPRSYVDSLLAHWNDRVDGRGGQCLPHGFNNMKLISGRGK